LVDPPAGRSGHSERLLPLIDAAVSFAGLAPGDLGGIAVVIGPGGFTGVRTGMAAAKAIAQSLAIPIWGVDTLDALAAGCTYPGLVAAMLDARRGSVFVRCYRSGQPLDEPRLVDLGVWLDDLPQTEDVAFVGEGALRYDSALQGRARITVPAESHVIRPATVARLAAPHLARGGVDPASLLPRYLRAPTMAPDWVAGSPTR
ncbi:MAG: tRNA (adenosine(37)-N6)-threonylcarbamoyltransferase complex dimerization subunit type 1 TsaB, partial [Cyanobacteria bacterium REEB65]|nr:tRNA (adenosine(37)-N6)-threonylcarbamoyltransferase complex dimerization subunit type 1 TsaB [Cyanobacteria bacterium REEB65]